MGMEKLTGFGMKNSLNLPSLANKYFISLGDENDEPIYFYTDTFMRILVRQNIKAGRCNVFKQHIKFEISDEVFSNISTELNVDGNVCEILEKYFEYTNKHRKIIENEYDSQFNDHRDNDEEKKTDHIRKKLNMLPIHKVLSKLDSNETQNPDGF